MTGLAITIMWLLAVVAFFVGVVEFAGAPAVTQQMAGLLIPADLGSLLRRSRRGRDAARDSA